MIHTNEIPPLDIFESHICRKCMNKVAKLVDPYYCSIRGMRLQNIYAKDNNTNYIFTCYTSNNTKRKPAYHILTVKNAMKIREEYRHNKIGGSDV